MTLGQLVTRHYHAQRDRWQHTSTLLAEIMNGPRKRRDNHVWTARHLDPYAERQVPVEKVSPKEFVRGLLAAWL